MVIIWYKKLSVEFLRQNVPESAFTLEQVECLHFPSFNMGENNESANCIGLFYRLNESCASHGQLLMIDILHYIQVCFFFPHIQDSFKLDLQKEHSLSKSMTIFTALVMYCQIIFYKMILAVYNATSKHEITSSALTISPRPHDICLLRKQCVLPCCCFNWYFYIYDYSPSFWNSIYVLTHLSARASVVFAC